MRKLFAEILKEHRNKIGLTQQEVGDRLHVSRQTVSNWENGKNYPDIPTLIEISNQFSLSLDYLLKGDQDYMKKVEKDYEMINEQKRNKKLSRIVAITILLVMLIAVSGIFLQNYIDERLIALVIAILGLPLTIASYFIYQSFYKKDAHGPQSLFIPKLYGPGLSINPNHPAGKIIWLFLVLFLIGIICYALFDLLIH